MEREREREIWSEGLSVLQGPPPWGPQCSLDVFLSVLFLSVIIGIRCFGQRLVKLYNLRARFCD